MIRKLIARIIAWALSGWVEEAEQRIIDLERHFVTKRKPDGSVAETLADVPVEERHRLPKNSGLRGASMQQRLRWLERTEGGTRVPAQISEHRSARNG
jgi:hypothetical protein